MHLKIVNISLFLSAIMTVVNAGLVLVDDQDQHAEEGHLLRGKHGNSKPHHLQRSKAAQIQGLDEAHRQQGAVIEVWKLN
jgi:hypothetical protein